MAFLCELQRDCKRFLAGGDCEDRALRGGVHVSYDPRARLSHARQWGDRNGTNGAMAIALALPLPPPLTLWHRKWKYYTYP